MQNSEPNKHKRNCLPLYKGAEESIELELKGNTGLWYDKFCNKWSYVEGKPKSWSLKTYKEYKNQVNPKLDWIYTAAKEVGDTNQLKELIQRQHDLVKDCEGIILSLFKTDSSFVTGLGREHPVENGFAWHHILGVPYLPGSSVKGLVRAWFEEWEDNTNSEDRKRIFGQESRGSEIGSIGSIIFMDALPIKPVQLKADVMTPHYNEYYNCKEGGVVPPPGDWISPNPIPFLVVDSGQIFQFAIMPRFAQNEKSRQDCEDVSKWLESALGWLGAGAKTAVGYGRFSKDDEAASKKEEADKEEADREEKRLQQQKDLEGLSLIAQEFVKESQAKNWSGDKNAFTAPDTIEHWLERFEDNPQADAVKKMTDLIEKHFEKLLEDTDRRRGKKASYVYSDRQRDIADRLKKLQSR